MKNLDFDIKFPAHPHNASLIKKLKWKKEYVKKYSSILNFISKYY